MTRHSIHDVQHPTAENPDDGIVASAIDLTKVYGSKDNEVMALDHVNVEFKRGEMTAIMGPSGSGKSTLMHCMAGLDTPSSGKVIVEGLEVSSMNQKQLTDLRREQIGFIFQSFLLLPGLTALEIDTSVRAGFPSPAEDFQAERIDVLKYIVLHPQATYTLRVRGDSMRDEGIFDGDVILVDRAIKPRHGHIVVAVVDGAFTCKKLWLRVGKLIDGQPAAPDLELTGIAGRLDSDGRSHRLDELRLSAPFGQLAGQLDLDGRKPFPLSAQAVLTTRQAGEPYTVAAGAAGDLEKLVLDARISGAGIDGRAVTVATPFAPLPLQSARIALKGVDPQRFHAAAPKALLDIDLALEPAAAAGVSGPAEWVVSGPLTLVNHAPGSYDSGTLPVESLAAALRCPVGSVWIELTAMRHPAGQVSPMSYSHIYLRPAFAEIIALLHGNHPSIYALLQQHFGAEVDGIRQRIEAALMPDAGQTLLQLPAGSPALHVQRAYYDAQDMLLAASVNWYIPARFRMETAWRRPAAGTSD